MLFRSGGARGDGASVRDQIIVALVAAVIFFGCIISPPSLMDDVDAVQAQIARNMLESGDWVTARLDGIAYLEKSPLIYWIMAVSFTVKVWLLFSSVAFAEFNVKSATVALPSSVTV